MLPLLRKGNHEMRLSPPVPVDTGTAMLHLLRHRGTIPTSPKRLSVLSCSFSVSVKLEQDRLMNAITAIDHDSILVPSSPTSMQYIRLVAPSSVLVRWLVGRLGNRHLLSLSVGPTDFFKRRSVPPLTVTGKRWRVRPTSASVFAVRALQVEAGEKKKSLRRGLEIVAKCLFSA